MKYKDIVKGIDVCEFNGTQIVTNEAIRRANFDIESRIKSDMAHDLVRLIKEKDKFIISKEDDFDREQVNFRAKLFVFTEDELNLLVRNVTALVKEGGR
jgi:hypothetical protein